MNPAQLLAQFDRLSDAPDATPRLRRFILDLAVRGKLVEQDPKDEPASELLKRIQEEKESLTKDGKVNQQKSLLPLMDFALLFSIPNSWVWVQLDTLAEKITDGEHLSPNKTTAGMPLLTATHVTSQGVTLNNSQFVSIEDGHKSRQRCDPIRGDILICSRGTIGRCAVVNTDEIFCLMGSVILARFSKETSPAYFKHFLSTDRAQMQMRGMSGATAVKALYLKDIRLCPVALPPLAEQHRIVAKVDELMALCDQLEAAQAERESRRDWLVTASLRSLNDVAGAEAFRNHAHFYFNRLPRLTTRHEHIRQLRQTIFNLAVCGKLVPQDPDDEPASELVKRIQTEKARLVKEGVIKSHGLLPTIVADEEPFQIPASWEWRYFIEIAAIQSNLVNPRDYPESPHIAPDNIESSTGRLLPYKTIGASAVFSSKHLFHAGCILYSKIRPALAKVVIVDFNGLCSADMYPILSLMNREYLHRYMLSQVFVHQSINEDNRVAMPKINQAALSKIMVAVPPLAEQHRIVAKVEVLLNLCGRLEAQLTTTQTENRRLLEATFHHALSA